MSNTSKAPSCASGSHLDAWASLVSRSIAAWDGLTAGKDVRIRNRPRSVLQRFNSLDDFLARIGGSMMFWFFQRREAFMSQKRMKKWSRDELDDYVLLPACNGFVSRSDCFFISHFWRTREHPDPDGSFLRLHQAELEPQTWSYIWVDWTCMPQSPRSSPESAYFHRCLGKMSGIIRNCGFMYFYPDFEPRLWILYEITEYALTCTNDVPMTSDIKPFLLHMKEMLEAGVQETLAKHGYRCSYDRDRQYLTSWLELLVLMKRLHLSIDTIRDIMDHTTWQPFAGLLIAGFGGLLELDRSQGTLNVNGKTYKFTPFPQWDDGKYSRAEVA